MVEDDPVDQVKEHVVVQENVRNIPSFICREVLATYELKFN